MIAPDPKPATARRPAASPPSGPRRVALSFALSPAPPAEAAAARLRAVAGDAPLPLTVRGRSMGIALPDGSTVAVAAARIYWPGDVVAFAGGDGRLVVHRLLGYRLAGGRPALLTRGDAADRPDAPVPLDRVVGRVVGQVDGRVDGRVAGRADGRVAGRADGPAIGPAAGPALGLELGRAEQRVTASDRLRATAGWLGWLAAAVARRLGW